MKFSLCIPVHNGAMYLREAILSALSQSRPADEILIVDDASTDDSAKIANSREFRGKVRYIFNERSTGWVDAFSRAAALAKGDFVTILGCDDLLHKDFLLHVEQALVKNPAARLCFTGHHYINADGFVQGASPEPHSVNPILYAGKDYAGRYLRGVYSGNHIHRFLGIAVSRNLLLKDCPIRKEAGLIADDDLFVRLGAITDVVGISMPLSSVRNHEASVTGRLESLVLRLAEDYLFQVRNRKPHIHIEAKDAEIYHCLAARFINELMLNGLMTGKIEWVLKAISLRIAFEKEAPGFMNNTLSFQSKLLWKLVRNGTGIHLRGYQKCIQLARGLKRFVSK